MTVDDKPWRSRSQSLFISAAVGAGLFFGRWAYDGLVRYGFELFGDSTLTQDIALVVALAIASPATFLVEFAPMSRGWFALNGALWGCVVYWVWQAIARIRQRVRWRRDQGHPLD